MSASAKLKRLSFWQWRKIIREVVAVVEAAEKARAADWQPHGKSYWEIEQLLNEIRDSADATLAALDEKLTGAEHPLGAERT